MSELNWSNFDEEQELRKSLHAELWGENLIKGIGKDMQDKHPDGSWKTINGAKVFVDGGKVVVGAGGNLGGEEKKESSSSKIEDKVNSFLKNVSYEKNNLGSKGDIVNFKGKVLIPSGKKNIKDILNKKDLLNYVSSKLEVDGGYIGSSKKLNSLNDKDFDSVMELNVLDSYNKKAIFNSINNSDKKKESKQEYFHLPNIKNTKDLDKNISTILSQYGSREMASIQVEDYLNENKSIAQEWLKNKNINSKDKLKSYLKNRQVKDRKPILKKRKESDKELDKFKAEFALKEIFSMAKEQNDAMERQIEGSEK